MKGWRRRLGWSLHQSKIFYKTDIGSSSNGRWLRFPANISGISHLFLWIFKVFIKAFRNTHVLSCTLRFRNALRLALDRNLSPDTSFGKYFLNLKNHAGS